MSKINNKLKILITDGASVNALGIVRHLGLSGKFEIFVVGYNSIALSKFSKYCNKYFTTGQPKNAPKEFINSLIDIILKEKIDFVLPVGFYAHKCLIDNLSLIESITKLCLPPKSSFEIATSKIETTQLAKKIGILTPKTINITNLNQLTKLVDLKYPLVIKSQKEIGGRMVEYVNDKEELVHTFNHLVITHNLAPNDYPIIQEYIIGEGVGFFAYYKNGKMMNYFMHERIREFPVSGGRSVCAKSFFDRELLKNGKLLLDELNWNGSAMVEFKRTKDNKFYLLEINPKLWGSLELAICSGVNFPLLMIDNAFDENTVPNAILDYKRELYFQWFLNGELYHFFNKPSSFFKIISASFKSKKDFWINDIKPNIIQFFLIFIDLYKVVKSKR